MKRFLLITALLTGLLGSLAAQEVHRLNQFNLDIIDGKTREGALINEMNLKAGTEFATREELADAVLRQEQDLVNLRVFDEIKLSLVEVGSEGETFLYDVDVYVDDSFTIYPIPYPKYSSNDGLRLGLKVFYDNAFGSMNNLYLGTNITFKHFDDTGWENTEWTINPQLNDVKIGRLDYDFGFMQQKKYSERKKDGEFLKRYNYFNTEADVKTTVNFGWQNKYYYYANPGAGFNYAYEGDGIGDDEEPFYLKFSHGTGFKKVDWYDNFREGFSAGLGNTIRYINRQDTTDKVKVFVDAETAYYKILNPRMNFSTRAFGAYSFNDDMDNLGSHVRGVEDSTMYGISGLFWNVDMNFAVIKWEGVGEAQCQPFFDMGIVRRDGESFDKDEDLRYGTGADFILFLDKLQSLHARLTIGADLSSDKAWNDFGKYEIVISSSLSY